MNQYRWKDFSDLCDDSWCDVIKAQYDVTTTSYDITETQCDVTETLSTLQERDMTLVTKRELENEITELNKRLKASSEALQSVRYDAFES